VTIERVLVESTMKVSILVLAALGATAWLRDRPAALRHWILAAALLAAAATALLQGVVPPWDIRPAPASSAVLATIVEAPGIPGAHSITSTLVRPWIAARTLGWLWAIGFAISLGGVVAGLARLAWLASRSQPIVDRSWSSITADVAGHYGIARKVVLLQSDHPTLLLTWGVRAPKIILPAAAPRWPADRIRIVIGHELAHVQRHDWVMHVGAALLRSVHWFNPLVWIACARLRRESEHACDDEVLNLGIDNTVYAAELLDLARTFNAYRRMPFLISPAPAMARPSSLERRIRAMLNSHLHRAPITRAACIAVFLGVAGFALPLAGFGAAAQSGPASFAGTLLDTVGRIMPDVPMTLTNVDTKQKYETRTDGTGHFVFAGLPAGDYETDAEAPGFSTRYRLTVKAGQNLQQPVTLQVGSLMETIHIVKSAAPAVSTRAPGDFPPLYPRQSGPCDQSPTGGCVDPPTKIGDRKPLYPSNRAEDVTILLQARIGVDGRINSVAGQDVRPEDHDFAQAAVEAVQQWRFTPTYVDGIPVEVPMKVIVNFRVE